MSQENTNHLLYTDAARLGEIEHKGIIYPNAIVCLNIFSWQLDVKKLQHKINGWGDISDFENWKSELFDFSQLENFSDYDQTLSEFPQVFAGITQKAFEITKIDSQVNELVKLVISTRMKLMSFTFREKDEDIEKIINIKGNSYDKTLYFNPQLKKDICGLCWTEQDVHSSKFRNLQPV